MHISKQMAGSARNRKLALRIYMLLQAICLPGQPADASPNLAILDNHLYPAGHESVCSLALQADGRILDSGVAK